METKELLQPIKNIYKEETISKKMFNIVSNNTLSNNLLGSYKINFIQTFDSSMTSSKIIDYIQKRENKPIIYVRASKSSEIKQGNTFNLYYINENQTLKEALSKEQIVSKTKIPSIFLKRNYIIVNLYTNFNIPSFTSKMILRDSVPAYITNILCEKIGIDKSYSLMPLSSNNTYDLYEVNLKNSN
jgi:lipopolysaccharide export LptBFGC system permease protein LptF